MESQKSLNSLLSSYDQSLSTPKCVDKPGKIYIYREGETDRENRRMQHKILTWFTVICQKKNAQVSYLDIDKSMDCNKYWKG